MITLYTFGPMFGLPDPSSFVTKALVMLKISGLPFKTEAGGANALGYGDSPSAFRSIEESSPPRWPTIIASTVLGTAVPIRS